jgi:hypothetical protein
MKTKTLIVILISLLVVSAVSVGLVVAKPEDPGKGQSSVKAGRPEKLEQIIFVHPVAPDKPGKPDKPPGKPPKDDEEPKENDYYEFWDGYLVGTTECEINPSGSQVIAGDTIAAIEAAAGAWDGVTADELFSFVVTTDKSWIDAPDGRNIISWIKFLPRSNIAVASMWYDPTTKIIYEFDIVFNAFHRWGIDPIKEDKYKIKAFDIQNIASHEFGHPVGLEDLYNDVHSELTMYGYSSKGETKKCSLEEGDINGAQLLYGTP